MSSPQQPIDELSSLGPLTIVLAEDDPINRIALSQILKKANCEVIEATDGQQVLDSVGGTPVDVVLMDVEMPNIDGLEATRMIRSSGDERVQNMKIVALTGYGLDEDVQHIRESGVDDYLAKPVDIGKLVASIKALLPQDR
jgi:CheY-like chemotaxis protein